MISLASDEQLPPEQRAIWLRCRHPTGAFTAFAREDIEQPITARFEHIASLYGSKTAVKTESASITYGELDRAADRIALEILDRAGRSDGPALLLFDQGIDVIAAIFGALRAAKPYVALSPSFPPDRIAAIMQDSGAETFVTHSRHLEFAASLTHRKNWLSIDQIESRSSRRPAPVLSPASIATIQYTSGSTGRPKGVFQTHRGIMHRAMIYTQMLQVCADDRLTLLHAPGFGSAIHHFYSALLNGATLYPFDASTGSGPPMIHWLAREEITLYHSAPSLFRQLAGGLSAGDNFPHLRVVALTGAPLFADDVELYKRHFSGGCILIHLMGATEAGWIRRYAFDKTTPLAERAVPVGYAIEDKTVSLINEREKEPGLGTVGEICVRSRYLAGGYWKNPALTAEKLIPAAGETIYRTGDLGFFASDGCLFHAGRKDLLTKIRGYRVELGDIEAALRAFDKVKDATVVAETRGQETELTAYIVPRSGVSLTSNALRRSLQEKLPDYMIPRSFILLDALPLTPNGKLDRKALPDPSKARPLIDTAYVAPTTSQEKQLARIWADAFGWDRVGVHDDFLELGGHSLLASRILAKTREVFGIELSIRQLLDAGTVAGLACLMLASPTMEDSALPAESTPPTDEETHDV